MKKYSFYRSNIAVHLLIFLWLFIAAVFVAVFLAAKDYSFENVKTIAAMIGVSESMTLVIAPFAFLRVEFTEKQLKVKFLFLTFKKMELSNIVQVGIFEKMSGQRPISYVFFSENKKDVNAVNRSFERSGKDTIFLSYPQKGLKEVLQEYFPNQFDENNILVFSR